MGWFGKKKDDLEGLGLDKDDLELPKARFPDDSPFGSLEPKTSPFDNTSKNRDTELILAKLDTINHRLDAIERRLAEIERIAKMP